MSDVTLQKLEKWAILLIEEDNALGESLIEYAKAWREEVEDLRKRLEWQPMDTAPVGKVVLFKSLDYGHWKKGKIVADRVFCSGEFFNKSYFTGWKAVE